MPDAPHGPAPQSPAPQPQPRGRAALLRRHRWITFLLPLLVFMLVGALEPTPDALGGKMIGLAIPYTCYAAVYVLKILLTTAAVVFVLPGYRQFPLRLSPLAVLVGMVGIVVWVGLCSLHLERDYLQPFLEGHVQPLLKPVGLDWIIPTGTRSAFNPLKQLQDNPAWAWGFLAIRFVGLVVMVPLVEEFFLRGFLMRFVVDARWWEVPMGKATTWAVVLATLVPMLMHPAELLAAAAWFSMVTWMYLRTRNVWDCVAAHAVTNLLLGMYVVVWDQWQLM